MKETFNKNAKVVLDITPDGDKFWRSLSGRCHREDGPAVEYADGTKEWWIRGRRHREDGPAVEYADGNTEWWLGNIRITADEHAARLGLLRPLRISHALRLKNKNSI